MVEGKGCEGVEEERREIIGKAGILILFFALNIVADDVNVGIISILLNW